MPHQPNTLPSCGENAHSYLGTMAPWEAYASQPRNPSFGFGWNQAGMYPDYQSTAGYYPEQQLYPWVSQSTPQQDWPWWTQNTHWVESAPKESEWDERVAPPHRSLYPTQRKVVVPQDVLLDYSWLDKIIQSGKTALVDLPKTVVKGLKGDLNFTFSDSMLVAKIPYYLGGLGLIWGFLAGGNKREGLRQGVAVASYLLGKVAIDGLVDKIYKIRYGIDLGLMYRSASGNIEKAFASSEFPRFDLLTQRHYQEMEKKMGVPPDVYEPDGAVREQLRHAIIRSRTLKLIVGNLISAVGAGYLARTDAWEALPHAFSTIRQLWKSSSRQLSPFGKVGETLKTLAIGFGKPLSDRLWVAQKPLWQKGIVFGTLGALAATIGYCWFFGIERKTYTLSDEANPLNLPFLESARETSLSQKLAMREAHP